MFGSHHSFHASLRYAKRVRATKPSYYCYLLLKLIDTLKNIWKYSKVCSTCLFINFENNFLLLQHKNIESRKDLELKLETALNDYIDIENKYKLANTKVSSLESELKNKEQVIKSYKERGKELENKIEELMKDVEDYRNKLEGERKSNEDLKGQLLLNQKECVNYVKKEAEAKSKVFKAFNSIKHNSVRRRSRVVMSMA